MLKEYRHYSPAYNPFEVWRCQGTYVSLCFENEILNKYQEVSFLLRNQQKKKGGGKLIGLRETFSNVLLALLT